MSRWYPRSTVSIVFATVSVLSGQTPGEPRVLVQPVGRLQSFNTVLNKNEVPLARKLALALAATEQADSAAARSTLEAAMKDAGSILSKPLAPPAAWSILTDAGEDILVARWSPDSWVDGIVPVVLWDDSIADTVIFRCRASQMKSPDTLAHIIDGLFRWDNRRLYGARLWLKYPLEPGGVLVGLGMSGSRGQFLIGPEVIFSGFLRGETAYLGISFVSSAFAFPGDLKLFDERFPPLRERVSNWTTEKLIVETRRIPRASVLPGGAIGRNRVLVHEAIKRDDLTIDMCQDLLTRGVGNGLTMGNFIIPELIRAAIEERRVRRFAPAIFEYLNSRFTRGARFGEADVILLGLVSENDIDLEEQAARYLESKVAVQGSLKYLQERGRTERARNAVASLDLDEWAQQRKTALAAINRRIGRKP